MRKLLLLASLVWLVASAAGAYAQSPPQATWVNALVSHYMNSDNVESWDHGIHLVVEDADGLEDIDTASISYTDAAGVRHPRGSEDAYWSIEPKDGGGFHLSWQSREQLSSPPIVLGVYQVVIPDHLGSVTVVDSLPTHLALTEIPQIIYPVNHSVIAETIPVFTWATYEHAALLTRFVLHVVDIATGMEVWGTSLDPGTTSVTYNADDTALLSTLIPGRWYRLAVSAHRQEVAPGGVAAFLPSGNRDIIFQVYSPDPTDLPLVPTAKVLLSACTPGRPYGPVLFVADADLSNPVRIATPWPTPDDSVTPYGCASGTFSPDGTQIALSEHGRLAILDLTALIEHPGQQARPMFEWSMEEMWAGRPSWSPDGQRLAYNLFPQGLYVVNADGSERRMLVPGTMGQVAWSPDGARIVFNMGDNSFSHLWLVEDIDNPTDPAVVQLTTDPAYTDLRGCWSPDGALIAFTRAPAGWQWNEPSSEVWVKDLATGMETPLTDTADISEQAMGWCPFDGYIYFTASVPGDPVATLYKIRPDGSGCQEVATLEAGFWPHYPFQWLPTGAWIDGVYALPGERVTAKIGLGDAQDLAGVQATIRYRGCCNTLSMYSAELGDSILDWMMPEPLIRAETASILTYAADPETQRLTGAGHLLSLGLDNSPAAQPGDIQLLSFDELLLSDDWGDPIERNALAGGVMTIPFAALQVSEIVGPVCADPEQPLGVPITITALDRDGYVMTSSNATLNLGALPGWDWPSYRLELDPTTPPSVTLTNGVWSGLVSFHQPRQGLQLLAYWKDIGGYSNQFNTTQKGDASGDGIISIFDVVKIANMAIGRGTWADWQLWAGDLNRDQEVNVFDVVICANKAMEGMASLSVGRTAASAPAPADSITVTSRTETAGSQVAVYVDLSNCAGLAGAQVELTYDAKKLKYTGLTRGALLKSTWAALDNDLGGALKAIAYTGSGDVLTGGKGTLLAFTFSQLGKGAAKIELTSVKLSDAEGGQIACQIGGGKGGGKPGGK